MVSVNMLPRYKHCKTDNTWFSDSDTQCQIVAACEDIPSDFKKCPPNNYVSLDDADIKVKSHYEVEDRLNMMQNMISELDTEHSAIKATVQNIKNKTDHLSFNNYGHYQTMNINLFGRKIALKFEDNSKGWHFYSYGKNQSF